MKKCTKCGIEKPLSEFNKKKQQKSGLNPWCKACNKVAHAKWLNADPKRKADAVIRAAKWNEKNREKRRILVKNMNYKRRYGLCIEQKQALVDKQNSKCAICANNLKDSHDVCVDHNHETGQIRGILCRKCNLGIGHLQDSIDILKSAQKYLQKYNKKAD